MAYSITLAGQNITNNCDPLTFEVDDTLAMGAGTGNAGSKGRATTFKVNTNLGPMSKAYGAGQTLPGTGGPYLVRQGEVIVTDASGNRVFGGFATKYTDITDMTTPFTTMEGIDYATSLQRIVVNETFSAQTDIQIIRFLITKYAPWINLQYLPALPSYTFTTLSVRQITLEQAIDTVAQISGYLYWVDFFKALHYVSPAQASTAPFFASSAPDFILSFPHKVEEYLVDDNAAMNRVTFYGGTKLSNDTPQDVSPLANGNNTIFPFAYSPNATLATGNIVVTLNGSSLVVGTANGNGAANTLKSQGGLADVLIDSGARTATFSTAPALGATVILKYRYQVNIVVQLTDQVSYRFFGAPYLDGVISDQTVYDTPTAIQRCRVLLIQQSFGLTTLKILMYKPGIQAGMTMQVFNSVRQINSTFLVQEVKTSTWGAGQFYYEISLGAWNWNMVDLILKVSASINASALNTAAISVDVNQIISNAAAHDVWTKTAKVPGTYYARAVALADGHDAYPGFSTITT